MRNRNTPFHHPPDRYRTYVGGVRERDFKNPSKLRNWIWVFATSLMIGIIGYLTNFTEKCRASNCFNSISFRLCTLSFLGALGFASYLLYQTRTTTRNRPRFLWEHYPTFSIISIGLCLVSIIFFSFAIYPAYQGAFMAFDCLALLLIVNLACVILYD